jgi:hypothetical protein
MRAMFGLVSLLVTIGVIAMIMHSYTLPAAQKAVQVKNQAEEKFGSNSPSGYKAQQDSIDLVEATRGGGQFQGLRVKSIVPGGAMQSYFPLMAGDVIVGVGEVQFDSTTGFDLAKDLLHEAKLRQQDLTVNRNGQTIVLHPR